MMTTLRHYAHGIRLYIALASSLVTLFVVWWAHTAYGGTTLFQTRIEEVYAWLAVGLIGLAITIGPFFKLFPRAPGKSIWFDARRLIGVSAAWFATLHIIVAYFGQFGGANPLDLPGNYQRAFLVGAVTAVILLAMAFTSFDTAFRSMGVWWFRLHRLVYIAILAALLHAFLIGEHATAVLSLVIITFAAGALFTIYVLLLIRRRPTTSRWQLLTVTGMSVLVAAVLAYGFSKHFKNTAFLDMYKAWL